MYENFWHQKKKNHVIFTDKILKNYIFVVKIDIFFLIIKITPAVREGREGERGTNFQLLEE